MFSKDIIAESERRLSTVMELERRTKMIMPDCRTDANYNQRYLKEEDAQFVRGYDWCAETVVDNFFDNLEMLQDDYLMKILNEKLPEHHEAYGTTYEWECCFAEEEPEERKIETYGDYFRSKLLDWMESDRDELIVSLIDDMTEEEYAAAREKAKSEE